MLLLSIAGAAVAPLVVVVATYVNEPCTPFKELFYNVNLYTVLLIGAPLYGVVTTCLFNRDYEENTFKNILIIPVSTVQLIMCYVHRLDTLFLQLVLIF